MDFVLFLALPLCLPTNSHSTYTLHPFFPFSHTGPAHAIHGLFSLSSTTYQFSFFACNYSIPQFNSARYQIYPYNNILHGVVILLVVYIYIYIYMFCYIV
jgi:hypothetical protein